MIAADPVVLAATHARDAGYDLILLAHVLAAAVGLGAVALSGAYAWTLQRSGPGSESIRRYYRPGVNWAGRVLFLVPVLGLALMAMSHGDWSFSDGWIMSGLALWAAVAVVAELSLWPAERRLQEAVSSELPSGPVGGTVRAGAGAGSPSDDRSDGRSSGPATAAALRSECLRVAVVSAALSVALLGTAVLMVAKP
jgi:hypothetical protein